jgi:hypothetical protein
MGAAFVLLVASALPAAATVPPRGDPAARLPGGSLAGEYWDLAARFDSGHVLLATVTITNALGGRTAIALGQLVDPNGTVHPFSRTESPGGFRLEEGGRRIDLRSIVLDQAGDRPSFVVDKDELEIDVTIEGRGSPAWPEEVVAPGCPLDVLAVAAPAHGGFRIPGRGPRVELRGLAAITHRWMPGLEADCLQRGVELFAMQKDLGVYFREVLAPDGRAHAWMLVQRGARTLYQGPPSRRTLRFGDDANGYPELTGLEVRAPGIEARVDVGPSLGAFEPLERIPAPLRWAIELRTRPRLSWSAPSCRITLTTDGERVAVGAPALVKLAYTNPLSTEPLSAAGGFGGR